MCTATWKYNTCGYDLFFNRDELKNRKKALQPMVSPQGNINSIYPVDTDALGTWIAVNQFGISMGLLNFYSFGKNRITDKSLYESRGNIIKRLISLDNSSAILNELKSYNLERYQPFNLFILTPEQKDAGLFTWDGTSYNLKSAEDIRLPLTSSSFRSEEVIESRKNIYNMSQPITVSEHIDFHTSHKPEKGPFSVCMHRIDAKTVSFSHITVGQSEIHFYYKDGNPCEENIPSLKTIIGRS